MRDRRIEFILILCAAIMIGARVFGPSALQRQDQPRTVSYTADIAANGRWLLPRDMFGDTATKPPLVNWLAAPLLEARLLDGIRRKVSDVARQPHDTGADGCDGAAPFPDSINHSLGALAGIAWLVNPANMSMIYHCRPDPVLIAFLTAAWILGTRIVCDEDEPRSASSSDFGSA